MKLLLGIIGAAASAINRLSSRGGQAMARLIFAVALFATAAPWIGYAAGTRMPPHQPGVTLQQLLSTCSMDTRRNPVTLFCPSGCVVEISNGRTLDDPPRITVAPACRALK